MQGLFRLSPYSAYLTVWLNRLWTSKYESAFPSSASQATRSKQAASLATQVFIPATTKPLDSSNYDLTCYLNDTNTEHSRTIAEYDKSGKWTDTYTYGDSLLQRDSAAGAEDLLFDGHGSVREAIASTGAKTSYSYDDFGNLTALTGSSTNPYTYNAERLDTTTNLQYLRARYADLSQGRFITRDSVLGEDDEPQSHNLYLYVQNDPNGHWWLMPQKIW
jgi:RHS repeat-associated protein